MFNFNKIIILHKIISVNKNAMQMLFRFHSINSSVDIKDVERHAQLASEWWKPNGPMKSLHSLNQIRVPFIRHGLIATGKVDKQLVSTSKSLQGLKILEVGCGAGLLTENLARIHGHITAIDPGAEVIKVAKEHAAKNKELNKRIEYRLESIEEHSPNNKNHYDAVVVSEVIEHVSEKALFLEKCIDTLKPGGSLFITTFNKTYFSWLAGIVVAENMLNLVPSGTHDWNQFISPIDIQRILEQYNCTTVLVNGFIYEFWKGEWKWIPSTDLSYALQAVKH